MIRSAFDDEHNHCFRCASFIAAPPGNAESVRCPSCHRRIADATELLSRIGVSQLILDLIPESVVRESNVLPLDFAGGDVTIVVDVTQPSSVGTADKLRFILNQKIRCLHADAGEIRKAIERGYPRS